MDDLLTRSGDACYELFDQWQAVAGMQEPHHQLGGWPHLVQIPLQTECQLASHGIYWRRQRLRIQHTNMFASKLPTGGSCCKSTATTRPAGCGATAARSTTASKVPTPTPPPSTLHG